MRTRVNGRNKKSSNKIFTSIDNQLTRGCKSIQADKKNTTKENRNSHAVITSPYEKTSYKEVDNNLTTQRPTMGGKTISAIHKTSNKVQMSSQELKLLSRRINPSEPLATPHSSPTKPPLFGSVTKKRPPPPPQQQQQVQQTQPTKMTKCDEDKAQFSCKHCDKKYKTRNGFAYHSERCKFQQSSSFENMCSMCQNSTTTSKDNTTAMIECVVCHSWLHTKCIGSDDDVLEEFHCIRCIKEEENPSKKIIKLSELCPTKETEKSNCISLFPDDESHLHLIKVEDVLTPLVTHDFRDWTTESPCLLLSDNSSSLLDDFSSSELLSPSLLPQSDWLHFANFELDFQTHDS